MVRFGRVLSILALAFSSLAALSQAPPTIPVTGNLAQILGVPAAYAGMKIQLQNCPTPVSVAGYSVIVQTGILLQANAQGLINSNIIPNDLITCNATTGQSMYAVTYIVNGAPSGTVQCYQVASTQGQWNLNTQQPITCSQNPPNPQDGQFRNLNVTGCFSLDGSSCIQVPGPVDLRSFGGLCAGPSSAVQDTAAFGLAITSMLNTFNAGTAVNSPTLTLPSTGNSCFINSTIRWPDVLSMSCAAPSACTIQSSTTLGNAAQFTVYGYNGTGANPYNVQIHGQFNGITFNGVGIGGGNGIELTSAATFSIFNSSVSGFAGAGVDNINSERVSIDHTAFFNNCQHYIQSFNANIVNLDNNQYYYSGGSLKTATTSQWSCSPNAVNGVYPAPNTGTGVSGTTAIVPVNYGAALEFLGGISIEVTNSGIDTQAGSEQSNGASVFDMPKIQLWGASLNANALYGEFGGPSPSIILGGSQPVAVTTAPFPATAYSVTVASVNLQPQQATLASDLLYANGAYFWIAPPDYCGSSGYNLVNGVPTACNPTDWSSIDGGTHTIMKGLCEDTGGGGFSRSNSSFNSGNASVNYRGIQFRCTSAAVNWPTGAIIKTSLPEASPTMNVNGGLLQSWDAPVAGYSYKPNNLTAISSEVLGSFDIDYLQVQPGQSFGAPTLNFNSPAGFNDGTAGNINAPPQGRFTCPTNCTISLGGTSDPAETDFGVDSVGSGILAEASYQFGFPSSIVPVTTIINGSNGPLQFTSCIRLVSATKDENTCNGKIQQAVAPDDPATLQPVNGTQFTGNIAWYGSHFTTPQGTLSFGSASPGITPGAYEARWLYQVVQVAPGYGDQPPTNYTITNEGSGYSTTLSPHLITAGPSAATTALTGSYTVSSGLITATTASNMSAQWTPNSTLVGLYGLTDSGGYPLNGCWALVNTVTSSSFTGTITGYCPAGNVSSTFNSGSMATASYCPLWNGGTDTDPTGAITNIPDTLTLAGVCVAGVTPTQHVALVPYNPFSTVSLGTGFAGYVVPNGGYVKSSDPLVFNITTTGQSITPQSPPADTNGAATYYIFCVGPLGYAQNYQSGISIGSAGNAITNITSSFLFDSSNNGCPQNATYFPQTSRFLLTDTVSNSGGDVGLDLSSFDVSTYSWESIFNLSKANDLMTVNLNTLINGNLTVTGTCTGCGSSGITLTTTGSSGPATLISGVLNVPVYSSGGITGSGTANYYPLWTGTTALGNGHIDDGVTTSGFLTLSEPANVPYSVTNTDISTGAVYPGSLNATLTATTPAQTLNITGWTASGQTLTFSATNTLIAGQKVYFPKSFANVPNFGAGSTFLNGQTVTVLSSGLSGSQFEANVTGTVGTTAAGTGYTPQEAMLTANKGVFTGPGYTNYCSGTTKPYYQGASWGLFGCVEGAPLGTGGPDVSGVYGVAWAIDPYVGVNAIQGFAYALNSYTRVWGSNPSAQDVVSHANATGSSGSQTITLTSTPSFPIFVGEEIFNTTNIATGTIVTSVSGTSIGLSAFPTGTVSGQVTFGPVGVDINSIEADFTTEVPASFGNPMVGVLAVLTDISGTTPPGSTSDYNATFFRGGKNQGSNGGGTTVAKQGLSFDQGVFAAGFSTILNFGSTGVATCSDNPCISSSTITNYPSATLEADYASFWDYLLNSGNGGSQNIRFTRNIPTPVSTYNSLPTSITEDFALVGGPTGIVPIYEYAANGAGAATQLKFDGGTSGSISVGASDTGSLFDIGSNATVSAAGVVSATGYNTGSAGTTGAVVFGSAGGGTVSLQPATGIATTNTLLFPNSALASDTIATYGVSNTFTATQNFAGITLAAGNSQTWLTRTKLQSQSDGELLLTNNAATGFTKLQLGGTTSSFPELLVSGSGLDIRLADNSGDAALTAGVITASGSLNSSVYNIGTPGTLGTALFANTNSGTISLEAASGALGTGVMFLPIPAAGSDTLATLGNSQAFSAAQQINATLTMGAGNSIIWSGRTRFSSSADGNVTTTNNAGTSFGRWQFGGTTASFPALKLDGAGLDVRLADDSGYAALAASTLTASTSVNIGSSITVVSCSTSGTAAFTQPETGASYKVVLIHFTGCLGTASYTFPVAFTNTPSVFASNNVAASIATTVSQTAVTVTGTTTTGALTLEDF